MDRFLAKCSKDLHENMLHYLFYYQKGQQHFPHENIFIQEKRRYTIGMHFICIIALPSSSITMNLYFMSKKLLNGTNTDTYMRQLFCSVKLPLCLCNVHVNAAKTFQAKIVGCHFEVVIRFAHCPIKCKLYGIDCLRKIMLSPRTRFFMSYN